MARNEKEVCVYYFGVKNNFYVISLGNQNGFIKLQLHFTRENGKIIERFISDRFNVVNQGVCYMNLDWNYTTKFQHIAPVLQPCLL